MVCPPAPWRIALQDPTDFLSSRPESPSSGLGARDSAYDFNITTRQPPRQPARQDPPGGGTGAGSGGTPGGAHRTGSCSRAQSPTVRVSLSTPFSFGYRTGGVTCFEWSGSSTHPDPRPFPASLVSSARLYLSCLRRSLLPWAQRVLRFGFRVAYELSGEPGTLRVRMLPP